MNIFPYLLRKIDLQQELHEKKDTSLVARREQPSLRRNRQAFREKVVVDQVRAYQAHLQQMYQEFRDVDLVLENTISRSLSGDDAWLFYFDRRHRTKAVRPKWILTQLRHTWPLPGNWPRHFLSTWLRDKGFGRGALRAFFGHADHGPAPLSDFDGTSMFELRRLGDEIDEMLSSLNIGAVQGWNTNS